MEGGGVHKLAIRVPFALSFIHFNVTVICISAVQLGTGAQNLPKILRRAPER